jgi:hypothetical protein
MAWRPATVVRSNTTTVPSSAEQAANPAASQPFQHSISVRYRARAAAS